MCCRTPWAAEPVAVLLPQQPCQSWGRAVCSEATPCGEKPSSDNIKGVRKVRWASRQAGPQGFPEGLTQTSLKASPFPPSLVETFIPVPWTHPLKVHTISEYSPIYNLLCNDTSPSQAVSCWHQLNVALKSEAEGSLPEWVGSQPKGHPVCLTFLWCHNLHSRVTVKHCGSLGFSVCHNIYTSGATAGMPWVSLGGNCAWQQHRVSLCHTRHFLPALWLGTYSCARDPGVIRVFQALVLVFDLQL